MDRTERFYRVDQLLRERGCVPLAVLMEELEVSRATMMRDLGYMRDRLNAPIVWDDEARGYRLLAEAQGGPRYQLPGMWFNASEIHALLAMQQLLRDIDPGLLESQVKPLERRLEKLLEGSGFAAATISERVKLATALKRRSSGACFEPVANATLSQRRLRVTHHNRHTDETMVRELSPQRLVYYRDNWYVDAWCHLRDDLRSFSVDAISDAEILETPAKKVSSKAISERFDAGYGVFSGKEKAWATLRFTPYKARWVADEQWHPDQRTRAEPDGSLILEVPYYDPRELLMDVLRHGRDCEVLGPEPLRDMAVAELAAAAALYRPGGAGALGGAG